MSEEHGHGDFKFLLGLFIGGIIGACVIFFLGTKEGKKVGKELKEKGEDFLDDVTNRIEEVEKKGEELIEEGKVIKEQITEEINTKKEEITHQAAEKLDDTLAKIEIIQEQGLQTTAELRKKLFKNIPKKR